MSGFIEAFVTPSGLPTWARVGIGITAELAFFAYVFVLGRQAYHRGAGTTPLPGGPGRDQADVRRVGPYLLRMRIVCRHGHPSCSRGLDVAVLAVVETGRLRVRRARDSAGG